MESTTFILGAGTSIPFGMPSGKQLLQQVCSEKCNTKLTENAGFHVALENAEPSFNFDTLNQFRKKLQFCNLDSIDRFIQDNKDFDLYAKACIAHALLSIEKLAAMNSVDATAYYRDTETDIAADNVFRKLWNEFAQSEDLLGDLKKHRFVTFNYDRILEHFLFVSLVNTFGMSNDDAIRYVEDLNITHVYGSLGGYESDSLNQYVQYVDGDDSNFRSSNKSFQLAIDSLDLILNDRLQNKQSGQVTQHFRDTNQVVVLGFGFDRTNCQYLQKCYEKSLLGTLKSAHVDRNMSATWKACMYLKKGAPVRRAMNYLRMDTHSYELSIGRFSDNDVDFLEHNVL